MAVCKAYKGLCNIHVNMYMELITKERLKRVLNARDGVGSEKCTSALQ